MSEKDALAQRYRRLLTAYPADHRQLHGEEMLDVLLAGARPGQRWPRLTDAADPVGPVQQHLNPVIPSWI